MRHISNDISGAMQAIVQRLGYGPKKMQMSEETLRKIAAFFDLPVVTTGLWNNVRFPSQLFGVEIKISPDMRDNVIAFMDGGLVMDMLDISEPKTMDPEKDTIINHRSPVTGDIWRLEVPQESMGDVGITYDGIKQVVVFEAFPRGGNVKVSQITPNTVDMSWVRLFER